MSYFSLIFATLLTPNSMGDGLHLGFHSPLPPCYKQNQTLFHNTPAKCH